MWKRHWRALFMKQVLPVLNNPAPTPLTLSGQEMSMGSACRLGATRDDAGFALRDSLGDGGADSGS